MLAGTQHSACHFIRPFIRAIGSVDPIKFFHLKIALGWQAIRTCFNHRKTLTKVQGCLSLHSCQTAMLPHVGKLNSAYSAFSNFHSTFIRAIGSVLSCPWANLGALLVHQVFFFHLKNTDVNVCRCKLMVMDQI